MDHTRTVSYMPDDMILTMLICIRDSKSMVEMTEIIGKSLGMVQKYCSYLEINGFVGKTMGKNGKGKKMLARSRYLTDKGKKRLTNDNIKPVKTME